MFAAIPYPNLHPDVFSIPGFELFGMHLGPFPLRWYALAYIAGLVLGWRYMVALSKNEKLWLAEQTRPNTAQADDFLFWATIGVIAGGRLGYVVFYKPDLIVSDPLQVLAIWTGGMSFHGGLIGVALAITFFCRAHKIPFLTMADIVAACTPIGLFFGRIANFINGELWGRPTDVPWAMVFPNAGDGLPRHPSQLYESALEGLVLFLVLAVATHRFGAFKRPGVTAGLFLLGYGIVRFSLESVREPDRHMPHFPLGLTMGMMLSAPMVLIGLFIIAMALTGRTKAKA